MVKHRFAISALVILLLSLVPGASTYAAGAGVTVTPNSGLTTTEAGNGQAMFSVVLDSEPTANVTIGLTSSNTNEGTVTPGMLTFTPLNWNTSQPVLVTGVDDLVADGNVAYTIVTGAASSSDPAYNGLAVVDASVTNTDDDTAGITVTPTSGLETSEAPGSPAATFKVSLNSKPTASVAIGLLVSDTTEGTVTPSSLTFTTSNWSNQQTVTVRGVDDLVQDGDIVYSIVTALPTTSDSTYAAINAADVSVTNKDNDTAAVLVVPMTGLTTTEQGGTNSFKVSLATLPTSTVTIALTSSDTGEGTVTPSSLTFTPTNGRTQQTVTVKGVNDSFVDGDIAYTIQTGNAVSTDPVYNTMSVEDVSVTNRDDEGIKISTSGVNVNESAGTATIGVQVTGVVEATRPITVSYATMDGTALAGEDYTTITGTMTFAAGDPTTKTITVPIINDTTGENQEAFTFVLSEPQSTILVNPTFATVNILQNDAVSFSASTLNVPEANANATFTVRLNGVNTTQAVTVDYATVDGTATGGSDFTASTGTVTIPVNQISKTFTVPILDDATLETNETFDVVLSAPTFASLGTPITQTVTILANDTATAGIAITAVTGSTTTEAGGTMSFKVALTAQPAANVVIGLSSSDTTEGTVLPTSLTFTPSNWSTPQTVTAKGVNDFMDDGDIAYAIVIDAASSTDPAYDDMDAPDVNLSNIDNDTAGVTVNPAAGITTIENGATATFSLVLTSQPTSTVTIALSSSDTTEGTITVNSATFTPANWNTTQSFTVKGVNDNLVDGNIAYSITTGNAASSDPVYNTMVVGDVAATNRDDEGVRLSTGAVTVNESAGSVSFDVSLTGTLEAGRPVTVTYGTRNGTATASGDYTATSGTLVFAVGQPITRTITVSITNDIAAENNETFNVDLTSPVNTILVNPSVATVTIAANDGLSFSASAVSIAETVGKGTFTVKLNGSNATQSVSVNYATSNGTATGGSDYNIKSGTLTFPPNVTTQTFQVGIFDDAALEGDETFILTLSGASNASLVAPITQTVTILANDTATAGINVIASPGLKTGENGTAVAFKVKLDSQPSADVTIGLTSSDTTEGTVSPSSLKFTTANWSVGQAVTVKGVNDFIVDGNVGYTVVTAAAVSADSNYNGLDAANVSVTNTDNDTASVFVTPTAGLKTTEGGAGFTTFTVALTSDPSSDVTIALNVSDATEGSVTPASLTFDSTNGRRPQTVTVRNVDDGDVDGNIQYTVITGAAVSTDPNYNGKNGSDIRVTNADNESVMLTARTASVNEAAGTVSFDVKLTGTVLAGRPVSVPYTTKNGTATAGSDFTAKSGTLTFTAGGSITQTVVVALTNDLAAEPNETFDFVLNTPNNTILGTPAVQTVTILSNDQVSFSPSAISVNENVGSATITVKLNGANTAQSVSVNYATSNGTALAGSDYTAKNGTLLFAPGETAKTFTVPITNDAANEGAETINLTLSSPSNASLGTSTAVLTITAND